MPGPDFEGYQTQDLPSREEIAWAAGIFEGEGCIHLHSPGTSPGTKRRAELTVAMKDRDVIERLQAILGGWVNPNAYRDMNVWREAGFERVQADIAMMWPWLGSRRRQRAKEVLAVGKLTRPRNLTTPSHCTYEGCERPHMARGFCSGHYQRMRFRERHPEAPHRKLRIA